MRKSGYNTRLSTELGSNGAPKPPIGDQEESSLNTLEREGTPYMICKLADRNGYHCKHWTDDGLSCCFCGNDTDSDDDRCN